MILHEDQRSFNFPAEDCPDGHEVIVQPCRDKSLLCKFCFYSLRGSFPNSKQQEVKAACEEHPKVNEKRLSCSL